MTFRRPIAAAVAAGVALVCALVAAVGPARHVRETISWPPAGGSLSTPLLLSRHKPDTLTARIPCSAHANPILATSRNGAGLVVTRSAGMFRASVDGHAVASQPNCPFELQLSGASAPTVARLFSASQLPSGSVTLTTAVVGSVARPHQIVFWALALLAAIAALVLAAAPSRRPGFLRRPRIGLVDVVVLGALVVWWIFGPAFFDDGWVMARQRDLGAAHGFSAYYTSFGVDLPLGYWLESLERLVTAHSSNVLVLRLPALVSLAVIWFICRWVFGRIGAGGAARWSLASMFLVAAFAWGMTLRPEPFVAVLVVGVVACAVRFAELPSAWTIATAVALVALAVTAHPSGIVAVAPFLVLAPELTRWIRAHALTAGTVATAGIALVVALATLGSDISQRHAETSSLRAFGDETAGWRDELNRYTFLSQAPYGSPLRRLSVALLLLAVLAFLLRRRRDARDRTLGIPAASLGIALVLLFLTPTKWPWHFGTLIGLAALAVGAETARIVGDRERSWDVRPFLVVAAAAVAAAWAWNPRLAWGDYDLRTLSWTLGVERHVTFSKLAPLLVVAALVVLAVARKAAGTWTAAAWSVVLVAVPLLAFTVAVLVVDTAKTSSWTLARQNLESLSGGADCGIAKGLSVAEPTNVTRPMQLGAKSSPAVSVNNTEHVALLIEGTPPASERVVAHPSGAKGVTVSTDFSNAAGANLVGWRFYPVSVPTGTSALRLTATPAGVTVKVVTDYTLRPLAGVLRQRPVLALPNLLPYAPCIRQPRVGAVAEAPTAILAFGNSLWPVSTDTSPFSELGKLYSVVRFPVVGSHAPPNLALYEVTR